MRRRRVVIIYRYCLFGEGIGRLLSASGGVDVVCLSEESLTPEVLAELNPDALLIDHAPRSSAASRCLQGTSPKWMFVLDPESNEAEVYTNHEVIPATGEEILARVLGTWVARGRPTPSLD